MPAEGRAATLTGVPAGGWFGEGSLLRSEPALQVLEKGGLLRVEYGAITVLEVEGLKTYGG